MPRDSSPSANPSLANASSGYREAGIVEKLLTSYGFIQCCERQARLFFHYSQYNGKVEHLRLGDPVEFEMTHDRKTGKPIASSVNKISSGAMFDEQLSQERVSGFITLEVSKDTEGRVAYENRGECFFLPFSELDVEGDIKLEAKDQVTFHIATDKSGNLRAKCLKLEMPAPAPYRGIVCTLKDRFGFIKRADCIKETFFHSSGCNNKIFNELSTNDSVEFDIQIRNCKEVAVDVTRLPPGSVVIEDISPIVRRGILTRTIDKSCNNNGNNSNNSTNSLISSYQQLSNSSTSFFSSFLSPSLSSPPQSACSLLTSTKSQLPSLLSNSSSSSSSSATQAGQPLSQLLQQSLDLTHTQLYPGRISYTTDSGIEAEISFSDRDVKGEYTLHLSDIIEFNIATDRRDNSQHATNIRLHKDTFRNSSERREQGYIAAINDSFGFIKCLNRDGTRVYFRPYELIDSNIPLRLNDEVEFTAVSDTPHNRMQAIRIMPLPNGTVFKNLFPFRSNSNHNNSNSINNNNATSTATTLSSIASTMSRQINSNNILGNNVENIVQNHNLGDKDNLHYHNSNSSHNNHLPNHHFGHNNNYHNTSTSYFTGTNGFGSGPFETFSIGDQSEVVDNDYPLIDLNTDVISVSNTVISSGDSTRFGQSSQNRSFSNINGNNQRPGIKSDSWSEILTQLPLDLNPHNNCETSEGQTNSSLYRPEKIISSKLKTNQSEESRGPKIILIRQPRVCKDYINDMHTFTSGI